MAYPRMTYPATVGNIRGLSPWGAGVVYAFPIDLTTKIEGQICVLATPIGGWSATRGFLVEFIPRYGPAGGTSTTQALHSYLFAGAPGGATESKVFLLGTGMWDLKCTNTDPAYTVNVEITSATVDSMI